MAQTTLGPDAVIFPTGTTAQRPSSPSVGMARFNSETGAIENYTSSGWTKVESSVPAGAVTNFFMASAPTGWTKSTSYNDFAMRIVSGTGGGTGGSVGFTTAFSNGSTGATTLSTSQIPSHTHLYYWGDNSSTGPVSWGYNTNPGNNYSQPTSAAGGGGSHNHSMQLAVNYLDNIMCSKN